MHSAVNRPVKLVFQPLSASVKFQKWLKLQIAIFRASLDDKGKRSVKMDKTEPMKFTVPQDRISFSHTLSLLTTIPYNQDTKRYENKEVEFEMALDIDGTKTRMSKKINLKDAIGVKNYSGKFTMESPSVVLEFRMEVKVQGAEEGVDKNNVSPNPKKIKFEDDYLSAGGNEEIKENLRKDTDPQRSDKGRHRTLALEYFANQAQSREVPLQSDCRGKMKKSKSYNQMNLLTCNITGSPQSTEKPQSAETKQKKQEIENKYGEMIENYRQLEKRLKQRDQKIVELSIKIEELELKIQMESKSERSAKELMKREQAAKANYQLQISSMKEEIRSYQIEVERLTKTALSYQESSKNIAVGNEQEIQALREKLRQLEKVHIDTVREGEYYETNLKDKDQIINDLKNKIYTLDKQNLQLQCKNKNLEAKLQKLKDEYETEINDLEGRVEQMKEDNKNIRLNSMKDIKQDSGDLKKRVQMLQKQLDRKEELLQKMTDLKQQAESQRANQNANLRKEVAELKQALEKAERKQGQQITSTTSIEYRLQVQKLKKELQQCKRSEKGLLIEKNRLQSSNHSLQDEVVKGKLVIANILNVVQQTGDQRLISQAYSLTE